jgi:dynein heavy chain, axonemal
MEQVITSIALNRVPAYWNTLAYPSKRGLSSWLANLFQRIEQLNTFKDDPFSINKVIMISRFFNPQSFLTAIMQVIARAKSYELNKLYIQTEITKRSIEEIDSNAKEGSYVYGFVLEGARWDQGGGFLDESKPKEMFSVLPVVYCKAVPVNIDAKEDKSLYICPVYKTEDRGGGTYVFPAQLKTRAPPRKWILAGVAILLDVEGVSDAATTKEKKKE